MNPVNNDPKALARLIDALKVFQEASPGIPVQTMLAFLEIARVNGRDWRQMQDVGKELGLAASGVSRNLDKVVDGWQRDEKTGAKRGGLGLVEKRDDPLDNRRKEVRATPHGRQFLTRLLSVWSK